MTREGDEREVAVERAVRALARRGHSAAGLRAKLDRAGLSEQAQTDAVETLERLGYLDDGRFAHDRAVRLAERGYGDDWIRADLEAHGIEAETVAASLDALGHEEERAVRAASAADDPPPKNPPRRLARRGFSEGTIEHVVAEALRAGGPKE
jgi:regulatory protein